MTKDQIQDKADRIKQILVSRNTLHNACIALERAHEIVLKNTTALDQALVMSLLFDIADRALVLLSKTVESDQLIKHCEHWKKEYPQIRKFRNANAHFDEYVIGKGRSQIHPHEYTNISLSISNSSEIDLYLGPSSHRGEDLERLELNATKAIATLKRLDQIAWDTATEAVALSK